jgi:hypothetical protein
VVVVLLDDLLDELAFVVVFGVIGLDDLHHRLGVAVLGRLHDLHHLLAILGDLDHRLGPAVLGGLHHLHHRRIAGIVGHRDGLGRVAVGGGRLDHGDRSLRGRLGHRDTRLTLAWGSQGNLSGSGQRKQRKHGGEHGDVGASHRRGLALAGARCPTRDPGGWVGKKRGRGSWYRGRIGRPMASRARP